MAVCTDKSVFYHIAKTGGVWVKEAMSRSGLLYSRCDNKRVSHPFGLKREHATPDVILDKYKRGRFSFCFVRHPVTWLQSFWCYRVRTSRLDKKFPLDYLWDDDFEAFVYNVLASYPDGFVSRLYQYYVGENADAIDYVGRQENLADDLVCALKIAGERFDECLLRSTGEFNVAFRGGEYDGMCTIGHTTKALVERAEQWTIEHFYEGRDG